MTTNVSTKFVVTKPEQSTIAGLGELIKSVLDGDLVKSDFELIGQIDENAKPVYTRVFKSGEKMSWGNVTFQIRSKMGFVNSTKSGKSESAKSAKSANVQPMQLSVYLDMNGLASFFANGNKIAVFDAKTESFQIERVWLSTHSAILSQIATNPYKLIHTMNEVDQFGKSVKWVWTTKNGEFGSEQPEIENAIFDVIAMGSSNRNMDIIKNAAKMIAKPESFLIKNAGLIKSVWLSKFEPKPANEQPAKPANEQPAK